MSTSTLPEFVTLLGDGPCGLAWLINLKDSITLNRTAASSARVLLEAGLKLHQESLGAGFPDAADTAHRSLALATQDNRHAADNAERKPISEPTDQGVEHITDFTCFRQHHFNIESLLTEVYFDNEDQDRGQRESCIDDVLSRLRNNSSDRKLWPSAQLGFARVWITPKPSTAWFSKVLPATDLRDKLGLIHYKTEDHLIAYALTWLAGSGMWAPAPLDGAGTRFRAHADDWASAGQWGMTVDLAKFAGNEPSIDGAREAVTSPIPLTTEHAGAIKFLGTVLTPRGLTPSDDDERFATRLLRGRVDRAIIDHLLQELQ